MSASLAQLFLELDAPPSAASVDAAPTAYIAPALPSPSTACVKKPVALLRKYHTSAYLREDNFTDLLALRIDITLRSSETDEHRDVVTAVDEFRRNVITTTGVTCFVMPVAFQGHTYHLETSVASTGLSPKQYFDAQQDLYEALVQLLKRVNVRDAKRAPRWTYAHQPGPTFISVVTTRPVALCKRRILTPIVVKKHTPAPPSLFAVRSSTRRRVPRLVIDV
jgi:hypothetical protein